jgi:hypothetical protein
VAVPAGGEVKCKVKFGVKEQRPRRVKSDADAAVKAKAKLLVSR